VGEVRQDNDLRVGDEPGLHASVPELDCVPLVWAFDYMNFGDKAEPEFSFMAGGVTARIMVWRVGGPLLFDRTYRSYWAGTPSHIKTISMNTPSGINTCIDGGHKIAATSNGLVCFRWRAGTLRLKRVA
jgi:hypothetical protein